MSSNLSQGCLCYKIVWHGCFVNQDLQCKTEIFHSLKERSPERIFDRTKDRHTSSLKGSLGIENEGKSKW